MFPIRRLSPSKLPGLRSLPDSTKAFSPAAALEKAKSLGDSQAYPQHTSEIATAASFRTWRGLQPFVARDPAIIFLVPAAAMQIF